MSSGRNDYPDPHKLPYGWVSEPEADAARRGRDATDKFLAETTKRDGPLAGLVAAGHIQFFALNLMLQESGNNPEKAQSYYEVIATCIGQTLGYADFLAGSNPRGSA